MTTVFRVTVGLAALATVVAVLTRLTHSYEHGIWLIAYLVLVGTAAQYLLVRGQSVLAPDTRPRTLGEEAALWVIGVVTVPLGVFLDSRILIAIGSITLLYALFLFWRATRPEIMARLRGTGARGAYAYIGLLIFMTVSVFVGMGLASDVPWT